MTIFFPTLNLFKYGKGKHDMQFTRFFIMSLVLFFYQFHNHQILAENLKQSDKVKLKVIALKGNVRFNQKKVDIGDVIKTKGKFRIKGNQSYVGLKSSRGDKMRLKNAVVHFDPSSYEFFLRKGNFYGYRKSTKERVQDKIDSSKKQEDMKIKTKSATMGIRGTKFWINESPKRTYLCVCEGLVRLKDTSKEEFEVKAGRDIFAYKSPKKTTQLKWAKDRMWKMATQAFSKMNLPVKKDPRNQ